MTKRTSAPNVHDLGFEERSILNGIIRGGRDVYSECADLLKEDCFDSFINKVVYGACSLIFENNEQFSSVSVLSKSKDLGLENSKDFQSIIDEKPASLSDIRGLSNKLKKRKIIREAISLHRDSIDKLAQMSATEDLTKIFSVSESALFDLISKFTNSSDQTIRLGDVIKELVDYYEANPSENIGLPTPWPQFNRSIGGGMRTGVTLIGARSGVGKAQPLYSRLLTVDGFKRMGDIKIGDKLINPNNKIVSVTHIHPHPQKEVYRIYFNKNIYVDACEDHVWQVEKNRADYQNYEQLKTTKELYDGVYFKSLRRRSRQWKIHTIDPVDFRREYSYVIPPYSLGALIGDGGLTTGARITSADPELIKNIENELPNELQINKLKSGKYQYSITSKSRKGAPTNIWFDEIKKLKLNKTSYFKFIPDIYKYGSIEARKEILRGLFDTDGSSTGNGIEYSTTSIELARDICFVVRSLGGLAVYKARYTKCNNKSFLSYRLHIKFNDTSDYFKLSRKKSICIKNTKYLNYHYITKIEKIRKQDCQCITVSSDDGMYITDNFVKTHNSIISQVTANFLGSQDIPILMLDTEMEYKDVLPRMIANLSSIPINDIESGAFGANSFSKLAVNNAVRQMEKMPIYYKSIAGKSFDEILSIIRRWVYKDVGLNKDGKSNDCLIIYDYFKIMDSGDISDMSEFQAMGFQISKLTDFCKMYDLPCLSFVQLNRDGVAKEGTDVIAQSDRLLWLSNSFSLFKAKSSEEIESDGRLCGNRKMITLKSRYGGEHSYGEYISMQFKGETCTLLEVAPPKKIDKTNNEQV